MSERFRVGITRDFLRPDGRNGFGDIGLDLLDKVPAIEREFLAEDSCELRAYQVRDYDALLVLAPRVTAETFKGVDRLAIVARFGVGYDNIDVTACTAAGVLLSITPDGVRRPVAASVMALVLALSHKLLIKDRLIRAGRWTEKLDHMGIGLTARTLGVVGLGNIGREILALAHPFGMRHVAADPFVSIDEATAAGAELMPLDDLLRVSDFACICCTLTPETHHLLDARRLALLRPTSYVINVARGPIVDQQALTVALQTGRLQGAGLDVFESEPIADADPLLSLDNVILAPHAICWTDECFAGNGRSACTSILEVAAGRVPVHVVNREAVGHHRLQEKLRRLGAKRG
jgi:phosphoglycerate dehydrogenase-like enzyme